MERLALEGPLNLLIQMCNTMFLQIQTRGVATLNILGLPRHGNKQLVSGLIQ